MREQTIAEVRIGLREIAERLVAEYSDLPKVTVLRCFSAAVHAARRAGCDISVMCDVAETMARTMLAARVVVPSGSTRRRPFL